MLNRVWHLWNGGPLIVGFTPYHAGWNPDLWIIIEPFDVYSYVVLPRE